MSGSLRTVGRILLLCALIAGMASVAGCSRQGAAPPAPVEPRLEQSYLGPYPMGVGVRLNGVKYTLTSVEISDVEWPYQDPSIAAPDGLRWAYVSFSIEGTGTNPAPGGGFFYPEFDLIADGETTPVDISSSGGDVEAPRGVIPSAWFSFQVPEDAQSMALLVTPSFAATQTVAYQLW